MAEPFEMPFSGRQTRGHKKPCVKSRLCIHLTGRAPDECIAHCAPGLVKYVRHHERHGFGYYFLDLILSLLMSFTYVCDKSVMPSLKQ